MKTLSNYINSSNIEKVLESCFDEEFNIIDEGKLGDSIAKLLGVSNMDHRTFADIWGKDTESKKDMATAQVVAAAEKDPELKKIAQKTFKRLENCESKEEAIKELIEWAEGIIRNGDGIKIPSLAIAVRNILKDQTDNKDALKTAKELDAWLNKKFPKDTKKTEKNIQKIEDTVAKTDEFKKLAADPDSEETGEEEKTDNSTLGITDDGEGKAVTPEQEEEAVSDTITDDKNFFIPLAKEAGIDGNNLRDAIIGLINDSLKNKTTDKDGNTVYKWKTDTKGFQTKNEGKLIKGLGAVLCGLMMINHKGMNEKIVDVLIDTGFSRNDYLSNLTKSDNE